MTICNDCKNKFEVKYKIPATGVVECIFTIKIYCKYNVEELSYVHKCPMYKPKAE